ncbi:MAG: hypothetical protein L6R43_07685 [Planctomycetes bacterium]|nr:hypothetical protein [Planctomycetota bacterium]
MKARIAAALTLALVLVLASPPSPAAVLPPGEEAPAPAEDVLFLKSGGEIRGRIAGEDGEAYAVKVGGALRVVDRDDVAEVRRGAPAPAPVPAPAAGGEAGKAEGEGGMEPPPATPAPPPPGGRKPGPKRGRPETGERDGEGRAAGPGKEDPPPALSPEATAWARTCVEGVLSADPAVRRSAAEALRALGPGARPVLEERRASAGEEGARALDRVAASLGAPRPTGDPSGPAAPAGPAPAEPSPAGPRERARSVLERVRTDLGLDGEAARAVGERLLAFGREVRATLEDARDGLLSPEEARTAVSDLRTRLRESLAETLSREQQEKLDGIIDGLLPRRR